MNPDASLIFPQAFRWGTATSSYQVEGNLTNNDWWLAAQEGGYIYHDQSAGLACDWWNRAEEDFDRMADLGLNAHRLSIEWSRVEPKPGVWDEAAIARYREMIQGLVDRGIEPMITLHHFTNPLWMVERGGWENPEAVDWFASYAHKIVSALGDLTPMWCTINEPMVMIGQTYALGRWRPGKRELNAAIRAGINISRAHGAAYHIIHDQVEKAFVGFAKHMIIWEPHRLWMPNDWVAAWLVRLLFNRLFLSSVIDGVLRVPGRRAIRIPEVRNTVDWLGGNYYQRYRIRTKLFGGRAMFMELGTRPGILKGPGDWGEIHPPGLSLTLRHLWNKYRLPLIITENGIPDQADEHRPGFIVTHLHELWRTMQEEIPVYGYYFWSLVDNFEWTEGYDPAFSFGLFEVDFETQERQMRPSGELYKAICEAGGLTPAIVAEHTPALLPAVFGSVRA
ncbi:MAG: glycoside hydrolase family 1 protein [Anaerolineae bacterium]